MDWLAADAGELRRRYARLYVPRNDGRQLKRNALVALGNAGGPEHLPAVERCLGDDALLAEHAAWASDRIRERHGLADPQERAAPLVTD